MTTVFKVLPITGLVLIILSCQSKMTFKLRSEELPDKPISLPITKDKDLWPTVTIVINGEKVRLHVDTGGEADAISLTREQIKNINLRQLDKESSTINAHGEKRPVHYYTADQIVIDGIRFTNCEIMEIPSAEDKFDDIGLIGLGFLQYFTVHTDIKNNLMKLYPYGYSSRITDSSWKMIHLDNHNRFKGKLSGYDKEYKIGFDSGAIYVNGEKGYNWIRVDEKELTDKIDCRKEYNFNVINTNLVAGKNAIMDSLCFLIFETPQPSGVDIFLGYDFFNKYEVIIDYAASTLYFR